MTRIRLTFAIELPLVGSVLGAVLHPPDPAVAIPTSMVSHTRAGDKPEPRGAGVPIGPVLIIVSPRWRIRLSEYAQTTGSNRALSQVSF